VTEARPAFYALAPGGWRDYVTLLHPPYTAWHLSYVAIGACLAPHVYEGRLGAAAAAFFLALGISAHALDELNDRPLATRIPRRVLVALTVVPLLGAIAIGIAGAIAFDGWLLVFVGIGAALVPVYNLELLRGAIHNDVGFALAWGAFPLLTGYFACAGTITWEALLAAAYATLLSYAQRVLSTPVRHLRRRTAAVSGTIELRDGGREAVTRETLAAAPERALQALAAANVALAAALLVLRLS
jgi:heme O synthase-like polyprenyltransferase